MGEPLVRDLDAGDGTADQLLAGVARATDELIGAVNTIGTVLEEVLERLEAVESDQDDGGFKVSLEDWVRWLRRSYRLQAAIPADWAETAGVRQELHALYAGWFAAYKVDGTPRKGAAAASWHDSLERVLERLKGHAAREQDARQHNAPKSTGEPPPWSFDEADPTA